MLLRLPKAAMQHSQQNFLLWGNGWSSAISLLKFPTASLRHVSSPPPSHPQFFHSLSCISSSHINNALWSFDCYMAAAKTTVSGGNNFGLMNWQLKVDATSLTFYTPLNLAGFTQRDWKSVQLSSWVVFHLPDRIIFVLAWDAKETA